MEYSIDLFKAEKYIKVSGLPGNVEAFKNSFNTINVSSVTLPIDIKLIAAVIGKSGSNLKRLAENFNTSIDINRDDKCIVVRGLTEQVEGAAEELKKLIATYEDREFYVDLDR